MGLGLGIAPVSIGSGVRELLIREAPKPDEFVCSLQQLGESHPSMLSRVACGAGAEVT